MLSITSAHLFLSFISSHLVFCLCVSQYVWSWECVCGKLFNFLQFKFQIETQNGRKKKSKYHLYLVEHETGKQIENNFTWKYSTKFSRTVFEAGNRTQKSHAHTIVIRLYGISIDSILFAKNTSFMHEKNQFCYDYTWKRYSISAYQTTLKSPPPLQTFNFFAIFLFFFCRFLSQ